MLPNLRETDLRDYSVSASSRGGHGHAATPYYRFLDLFDSVLAGGAINGTAAQPGPGNRTVVDTNSKISVANLGTLSFATGEAVNDGFWEPLQTRTAGETFLTIVTPNDTNGIINVGLSNAQSGAILDAIQFSAAGILSVIANGAAAVAVGSYSAGIAYTVALVCRSTGMYFFIKGGAYTTWTLLWFSSLGSANVYPAVQAASTIAIFTVAPFKIAKPNLTILPIAYDTFTRADGAIGSTEATGPDGQAVESQAWTAGQASAYLIATGALVNTPTLGAEAATDPGMETWTDAFTLTNWTKILAGTSTLNKESSVIHGGSFAARMDIDGSNSNLTLHQTMGWNVGDIIKATFWAKSSVAGKTLSMSNSAQVSIGPSVSLTTSYAQYTRIFRALSNSSGWKRTSAASSSLYLDDVSFKRLQLSSLIADVQGSNQNFIIEANLTIPVGMLGGFYTNLDSDLNVVNPGLSEIWGYRLVYLDTVNVYVVEKVRALTTGAGDTLISTTAYTHVDGALLRVVVNGTSLTVYYNGAKIVTSTMTDTPYTLCSPFLADPGVLFDNFQVLPLGANGEYSAIGAYQ